MKTLRTLCAAAALSLILSVSAMAGDIPTWVVSPTPPPPPSSAMATDLSAANTDDRENVAEAEPFLSEITLSVLQLLLVF